MPYTSKTTFLGHPLVDIQTARTVDGVVKRGIARGWIAVGDVAYGRVIAVGGFAVGVIAVGGAGVGGIVVAGGGAGLISVAGAALSLVLSFGGMAVSGGWADGGLAIGGYSARGGLAIGWNTVEGGAVIHLGETNSTSAGDGIERSRPEP